MGQPPAGATRGGSSSSWPTLRKAPIAIEAVLRIGELFAIEREINGLSASARLAERQKCSAPLPDNLRRGMPPSAKREGCAISSGTLAARMGHSRDLPQSPRRGLASRSASFTAPAGGSRWHLSVCLPPRAKTRKWPRPGPGSSLDVSLARAACKRARGLSPHGRITAPALWPLTCLAAKALLAAIMRRRCRIALSRLDGLLLRGLAMLYQPKTWSTLAVKDLAFYGTGFQTALQRHAALDLSFLLRKRLPDLVLV